MCINMQLSPSSVTIAGCGASLPKNKQTAQRYTTLGIAMVYKVGVRGQTGLTFRIPACLKGDSSRASMPLLGF